MRSALPNLEAKLAFFKTELLSREGYTSDQIATLKSNFAHFRSEIKTRLCIAYYKEDLFLKNNQSSRCRKLAESIRPAK